MQKTAPKDVFLHLLATAALYASVVSFITLVFQYINYLFPDQLNYYREGTLNSIRWSTSVLIPVFIVFILVSWLINREDRREIKIRKWLIYLTLFLAAIAIIGDLVTLIYNFYGGELTMPFFFKILSLLLIAAGVFGYYIWDLKLERADHKKNKIIAWAVSVVVLIVVIGGFFIVGSPAQQRARRFDERRINDLQTIQRQLLNYWVQKGGLPGILEKVEDSISGFALPKDPETGADYEYHTTSFNPPVFQLCATFKTDSNSRTQSTYFEKPRTIPLVGGAYSQNWNHGPGRQCFTREIDPELYKTKGIVPFN